MNPYIYARDSSSTDTCSGLPYYLYYRKRTASIDTALFEGHRAKTVYVNRQSSGTDRGHITITVSHAARYPGWRIKYIFS